MIKLVWRFAFIVAVALAFAWLADRPGSVDITWMGRTIHMSVLVGIIILVVGLWAFSLLWKLFRSLWRSPKTTREYFRFRRQRKAYDSLSRGIIAAGAGDANAAARHAQFAGQHLKDEPLVTLLAAQAAQLKGDRASVRAAFEGMTADKNTELLGLRGLYAEARQAGDWTEARRIAEKALAKNPRLPWASASVLQAQLAAKDWQAAASTVAQQSRSGLVTPAEAHNKQAALLTALALQLEAASPAKAREAATQALAMDPAMVPAALVAARVFSVEGHPKKAARVLRNSFEVSPHPDTAATLANTFAGDDAEKSFERIRDLTPKAETNVEHAFARARAAVAARRHDVARATLEPHMQGRPQARLCALMAQIEDAQNDRGRSREWLAKAVHAPRDPMWVSDGVALNQWQPLSPVTGEITPCEWKPPFDMPHGQLTFDDAAGDPVKALAPPPSGEKSPMTHPRAPDDPGID